MKRPKISIVILAINREEYVLNAIRSVARQLTDRRLYEILVVKNYLRSDDLLIQQDVDKIVKVPFSDQGKATIAGAEAASSDVICFLDDDDMYLDGKIETVMNVFGSDSRLGFYHNSYRVISDEGRTLRDNFHKKTIREFHGDIKTKKELNYVLSHGANVNMSSICVRRSVIDSCRKTLQKVYGINDDILLFSAVEDRMNIYLDPKVLTVYRFHNSNSHNFEDNSQSINAGINRLRIWIESYGMLSDTVRDPIIQDAINCRIARDTILLRILDDGHLSLRNLPLKNFLRCLIKHPSFPNIATFLALLAGIILRKSNGKVLVTLRKKVLAN